MFVAAACNKSRQLTRLTFDICLIDRAAMRKNSEAATVVTAAIISE